MIFSGRLLARVGLATNKPAEFVIVMFSQDTRGDRRSWQKRERESWQFSVSPEAFTKDGNSFARSLGVGSAGFAKCSELSAEVAKVEYHEGGSLIPFKSPGRLTFSDVTLERRRHRTRTCSGGSRRS